MTLELGRRCIDKGDVVVRNSLLRCMRCGGMLGDLNEVFQNSHRRFFLRGDEAYAAYTSRK